MRITIIFKIFRILNETQKIQVQVRNLRSQTNEKKLFTVPLKTIFKKRKKNLLENTIWIMHPLALSKKGHLSCRS